MNKITKEQLMNALLPKSIIDAMKLIDELSELDEEKKELLLELKGLYESHKEEIIKHSFESILDVIDEFLEIDLLDEKDYRIHFETMNESEREKIKKNYEKDKKDKMDRLDGELKSAEKYLTEERKKLETQEKNAESKGVALSSSITNFFNRRIAIFEGEVQKVEKKIEEEMNEEAKENSLKLLEERLKKRMESYKLYIEGLDLNKDGVLEFSEYIKMFIGE